jgi:hypothetical protein
MSELNLGPFPELKRRRPVSFAALIQNPMSGFLAGVSGASFAPCEGVEFARRAFWWLD